MCSTRFTVEQKEPSYWCIKKMSSYFRAQFLLLHCLLGVTFYATSCFAGTAQLYGLMFQQAGVPASGNAIFLYNPYNYTVFYNVTTPNMLSTGLNVLNQRLAPCTGAKQTVSLSFALAGTTSDFSKGVCVATSDSLSVIGLSYSLLASDAFNVPPVTQLGTQYIVVTSIIANNILSVVGPFEFAVLATRDNTIVNIQCNSMDTSLTLSGGGSSCAKGNSIMLSLNSFQTAEIKGSCCGASAISSGDPSGTVISSNYPIFVTTGAAYSLIDNILSADIITAAIPSVDQLGTKYVIVPSGVGDFVKIVAVNAGTTYSATFNSGTTLSGTLTTAGSTASFRTASTDFVFVSASGPIVVAQIAKTDVFMIVPTAIDRLDLMSSTYSFNSLESSTIGWSGYYVKIIVPTADVNGLTLNRAPISPAIFTVVSTSLFSAVKMSVSNVPTVITHTLGRPFSAYWFGSANMEGTGTLLPGWSDPLISWACPLVQTTSQPTTTAKKWTTSRSPTVKTTVKTTAKLTAPTTTASKQIAKTTGHPTITTKIQLNKSQSSVQQANSSDMVVDVTDYVTDTSDSSTLAKIPEASASAKTEEESSFASVSMSTDWLSASNSDLQSATDISLSTDEQLTALVTDYAVDLQSILPITQGQGIGPGIGGAFDMSVVPGVVGGVTIAVPGLGAGDAEPTVETPFALRAIAALQSGQAIQIPVEYSSLVNHDLLNEVYKSIPINSSQFGEHRCTSVPVVDGTDVGIFREMNNLAAFYRCQPGLRYNDGGIWRSLVCNASYPSTPASPICYPIQCNVKKYVINADMNEGVLAAGDMQEAVCSGDQRTVHTGLRVENVMCTLSGEVESISRRPTTCSENSCRPTPYINNAIASYNATLRTVEYVCFDGYRFTHGLRRLELKCDVNGTWNYDRLDSCIEMFCPVLVPPIQGTLSSDNVKFSTVIKATCNVGYMFPDGNVTQNLQCVQHDNDSSVPYLTWNSPMAPCEPVICKQPPTIVSGYLTPNLTAASPYQTTVICSCYSGLRFEDGTSMKAVHCQSDGNWNDTLLGCGPSRCPAVPQISRAHPSTRLALQGTLVKYVCEYGYWFTPVNLQASADLHKPADFSFCDGNQWNPINIVCQGGKCYMTSDRKSKYECTVIVCPRLSNDNAIISNNDVSIEHHKVVDVMCNTGFRPVVDNIQLSQQNISVTCTIDGIWAANFQGCQPVNCGRYPTVKFGQVVGPSDRTTYGSRATYTCQYGYYFGSELFTKTITCGENGQWTPLIDASCTPITCRPLLTQQKNTTAVAMGTVVNVSCLSAQAWTNIKTPSAVVSNCDKFGRWNPTIPDCIGVITIKKLKRQVVEGPQSQLFGTVICAMVSSAALAVMMTDFRPTVKSPQASQRNVRKKKSKKKNLKYKRHEEGVN